MFALSFKAHTICISYRAVPYNIYFSCWLSNKVFNSMMELSEKVALITGASAGIGRAIASSLVKLGVTVIGCARRFELLEVLSDKLNGEGPGSFTPVKCDLSNEDEILNMFSIVKEKFGKLHVFVNNAGVVFNQPLISGRTDLWRSMVDVNIMAPAICGREAFKLMSESNVKEGNIIFINSTLGKKILQRDSSDFYTITKHALTVMIKLFRREISPVAPHIRCSSVSPGAVKTEIWYSDMGADKAEKFYKDKKGVILQPSDVADAIIYILQTPVRYSINDIEIDTALYD